MPFGGYYSHYSYRNKYVMGTGSGYIDMNDVAYVSLIIYFITTLPNTKQPTKNEWIEYRHERHSNELETLVKNMMNAPPAYSETCFSLFISSGSWSFASA